MIGRVAAAALVFAVAGHAGAATLVVQVDGGSSAVVDAVVWAVPLLAAKTARPAAPLEIAQVDKTFVPGVSVAQVGAAVSFPNRDPIRHHVYSFSPARVFDLKLYSGVPVSPVTFDKAGVVVLGCNIHDRMVAYLVVVDTPHFAKSDENGNARIEGLAPGEYRISVWHPRLAADAGPKVVAVAGDTTLRSTIELKKPN